MVHTHIGHAIEDDWSIRRIGFSSDLRSLARKLIRRRVGGYFLTFDIA